MLPGDDQHVALLKSVGEAQLGLLATFRLFASLGPVFLSS